MALEGSCSAGQQKIKFLSLRRSISSSPLQVCNQDVFLKSQVKNLRLFKETHSRYRLFPGGAEKQRSNPLQK